MMTLNLIACHFLIVFNCCRQISIDSRCHCVLNVDIGETLSQDCVVAATAAASGDILTVVATVVDACIVALQLLSKMRKVVLLNLLLLLLLLLQLMLLLLLMVMMIVKLLMYRRDCVGDSNSHSRRKARSDVVQNDLLRDDGIRRGALRWL